MNNVELAIGRCRAEITPTVYFIKNIAIINASGSQLPGIKNDWFSVENVTPCNAVFIPATTATTIPVNQKTIPLVKTPKAESTP